MPINKTYKFSDIKSLETFLAGQIDGANIGAGVPNLVGKTLTFLDPVGTVTFVEGTDPNDSFLLRFVDIKAQVESAIPAITVVCKDGRIGFVRAVPSTGITIAASSAGGNAQAIGTVDVNGLTYGSGGDLDGLDLTVNIDGAGGDLTVTFAAPVNRGDVLAQLNAVLTTDATAYINDDNKLVIRSATTGAMSSVIVRDVDASLPLGLTSGGGDVTTTGAATNLANKTLGFDTNTSVSKAYTPAVIATTAPCWTWIELSGDNTYLLTTWE